MTILVRLHSHFDLPRLLYAALAFEDGVGGDEHRTSLGYRMMYRICRKKLSMPVPQEFGTNDLLESHSILSFLRLKGDGSNKRIFVERQRSPKFFVRSWTTYCFLLGTAPLGSQPSARCYRIVIGGFCLSQTCFFRFTSILAHWCWRVWWRPGSIPWFGLVWKFGEHPEFQWVISGYAPFSDKPVRLY
jgi:hypothetical protein